MQIRARFGRRRVVGTAIGLVASVVAGPLAGPACTPAARTGSHRQLSPGDHERSLVVGDATRSYRLHVPPAVGTDPDTAMPLLVAFHGGGGQARGFQRYAGLDAVADREGFTVAYPDGSGRLAHHLLTWNAGRCCGYATRHGIDDVAFFRALVDDVAAVVPVDRRRVYATGHSNGGMMSYRVAVEAPDVVAAIASVGGAMILSDFEPLQPVPVLHIHSVDDPRALYEGGLGPPFPLTGSRVLHNPVERELQRWVENNGCPTEPTIVAQRSEPETGHTATLLRYAPCTSGATVELWRLTGAGHGWPGGSSGMPERLIGPATNVIDAAEEIWRFLSRHVHGPVHEEQSAEGPGTEPPR